MTQRSETQTTMQRWRIAALWARYESEPKGERSYALPATLRTARQEAKREALIVDQQAESLLILDQQEV